MGKRGPCALRGCGPTESWALRPGGQGALRSPCGSQAPGKSMTGEGRIASLGDREVGTGRGSTESSGCLVMCLQTSLSPTYGRNKIIKAED